MHLSKRAVFGASRVGQPVNAVALLALLLVGMLGPQAAMAMTRASRAHTRAVAQDQEPTPSRAHGGKKSSAKSKSSSSDKKNAKAVDTKKSTKSKRNRHDDDVEPVEMKRARGSKSAAKNARELAKAEPKDSLRGSRSKRGNAMELAAKEGHTPLGEERVVTHRQVRKAAPAPVEVADNDPVPAPKTVWNNAPKKLTTDDFVRATGRATTENTAFASGESHPDEMDDTQPTNTQQSIVIKQPAPKTVKAAVTAPTPASAPTLAAANRVDGFGAEGAPVPTHRTLARTMAAHKNDPLLKATPPPRQRLLPRWKRRRRSPTRW
ncbi:hypothetical protein ACFQBQ_10850 [Granulicella cerasi]|uniref:Transmembrane protein n=1 Tax=Granulicella cerasi TaxID=741063 RepID=A0ABW1ZA64_9BACT